MGCTTLKLSIANNGHLSSLKEFLVVIPPNKFVDSYILQQLFSGSVPNVQKRSNKIPPGSREDVQKITLLWVAENKAKRESPI